MKSEGTKQLIAEVEQTTGYKVVVDTVDGISEHAQMISARPDLPVHTIRVSKAKLPTADYIVAAQCAMLLRTLVRSDPHPCIQPHAGKISLPRRTRGEVQAPFAASSESRAGDRRFNSPKGSSTNCAPCRAKS